MNVLVLNAGSSSVKYCLVDSDSGQVRFDGKVERIGSGRSHADAFAEVLTAVRGNTVDAVGHRVVHGASLSAPTLIDDATLAGLRASVRGRVLDAASPDFDTVRAIWNAMIDRKPALIV